MFPSLTDRTFRIDLKIRWLTYKTLCKKQSVYLQMMLATSLPLHSLRSHEGITLSVLRIQTRHKGTSLWHPLLVEKPPIICLFDTLSCYLQDTSLWLQKTFEYKSLWLGLSTTNKSTPNATPVCCLWQLYGLCHWTMITGDIGNKEVWLIDWLDQYFIPGIAPQCHVVLLSAVPVLCEIMTGLFESPITRGGLSGTGPWGRNDYLILR